MNIASAMAAKKNITDNRSNFTHRIYRRVLGAMCKRHGRSNAMQVCNIVQWLGARSNAGVEEQAESWNSARGAVGSVQH